MEYARSETKVWLVDFIVLVDEVPYVRAMDSAATN